MHTYSFIVSFGKSNTFSITINADNARDAVIRMNDDLCEGSIFKMIATSDSSVNL
jgi:hypothetical protein